MVDIEDIFIPIMLVLGIVIVIWLFITLGSSWNIDWTTFNPTLISLLPWFVIFGFAVLTLVFISRRK